MEDDMKCLIVLLFILPPSFQRPANDSDLSLATELRNKREYMFCKTHDDCNPGYFCYESGLCAKCTDCSIYHRLPGEQHCARHPHQCGTCFDGFKPEVFTDNERKLSCVKISTPTTDYTLWYIIIFVVSVGVLVTCAACAFWFWKTNICNLKSKVKKGPSIKESNKKGPKSTYNDDDYRPLAQNPSAPPPVPPQAYPPEFQNPEKEQLTQAIPYMSIDNFQPTVYRPGARNDETAPSGGRVIWNHPPSESAERYSSLNSDGNLSVPSEDSSATIINPLPETQIRSNPRTTSDPGEISTESEIITSRNPESSTQISIGPKDVKKPNVPKDGSPCITNQIIILNDNNLRNMNNVCNQYNYEVICSKKESSNLLSNSSIDE